MILDKSGCHMEWNAGMSAGIREQPRLERVLKISGATFHGKGTWMRLSPTFPPFPAFCHIPPQVKEQECEPPFSKENKDLGEVADFHGILLRAIKIQLSGTKMNPFPDV